MSVMFNYYFPVKFMREVYELEQRSLWGPKSIRIVNSKLLLRIVVFGIYNMIRGEDK